MDHVSASLLISAEALVATEPIPDPSVLGHAFTSGPALRLHEAPPPDYLIWDAALASVTPVTGEVTADPSMLFLRSADGTELDHETTAWLALRRRWMSRRREAPGSACGVWFDAAPVGIHGKLELVSALRDLFGLGEGCRRPIESAEGGAKAFGAVDGLRGALSRGQQCLPLFDVVLSDRPPNPIRHVPTIGSDPCGVQRNLKLKGPTAR